MKKYLTILFLFVTIIANCGNWMPLPKDVWYVRPSTGTYGTSDGTSYNNAFDGFADITWANINAGDLLLCYGYFSNEVLTIGSSGSIGNPIKIKGINCTINGAATQLSCIDINNYDYITLENFYLTNATTNGLICKGTATNIIGINIISEFSGNQAFQHLNTAQAVYYNCQGNKNIDDGMSLHDATNVICYNSSFYGNADAFGGIADSRLVGYGITLEANTQTTMNVDAATTDSSAKVILYNSKLILGSGLIDVQNKGYAELWYCDITASTTTVVDVGGASVAAKGYFKSNYCTYHGMAATKGAIVARVGSVVTGRNNVFYGSGVKTGIGVTIINGGTFIGYNNIFSNLAIGVQVLAGGIASSKNSCFYDNTANVTGTLIATDSVITNPNFYSAINKQFWLTTGSSCENTGLNLGATYQMGLKNNSIWTNSINLLNQNSFGAGWEIGAYIYEP